MNYVCILVFNNKSEKMGTISRAVIWTNLIPTHNPIQIDIFSSDIYCVRAKFEPIQTTHSILVWATNFKKQKPNQLVLAHSSLIILESEDFIYPRLFTLIIYDKVVKF